MFELLGYVSIDVVHMFGSRWMIAVSVGWRGLQVVAERPPELKIICHLQERASRLAGL